MEVYLFAISVSLLHFFVLIRAQNFKREKQGVSFAKFVKASSVKFDEPQTQLASLKVSRPGECTFECINNQECYLVNFASGSEESGKHTCELLKVDKFSRPTSLYKTAEFDHYFIKTPCMESPCQKGRKCLPVYDRDEYRCLCPSGFTGNHCEAVNWLQLTPSTVCFGSKGDSFGSFSTPKSGDVITFKLIYQSGHIGCALWRYSHWGCPSILLPAGFKMGTHITDTQRKRLLPKDEFMKDAGSNLCSLRLYYNLPGIDINSPVLLFANSSTPLPVTSGMQFQIWSADDLGDCFEFDNDGGQTCVQVFGLFI